MTRVDLDDFTGREDVSGYIFLSGPNPWSMTDHAASYLGQAPCPVCHDASLGRKVYCLGCDRTGLDGHVSFPGLPIDEARDPDWESGEWTEVDRRVA